MLKAGIIGCGGITERRHGPMLASLSDRVTVVALADLSQERLDLMGGKLGVASENLYTDWEQMLTQEKIWTWSISAPLTICMNPKLSLQWRVVPTYSSKNLSPPVWKRSIG